MKIQLDYDSKTITLENNVKLKDFVDKIQTILPDWDKWTLNTQTIINNWSNPIIIREQPYIPRPWWETQPIITYDTNTAIGDTKPDYNNITGKYNIEIQ